MQLVRAPIFRANPALPRVPLCVDRITIAKRLWRGTAADGVEFGFELEVPLKHNDTVHESVSACYVIEQTAEPVVEISLAVTPSAAAGIGWAIGNLHLELSADATRMLAPDEPAVRQLLERLKVPYQLTTAIFRPGRFARGAQPPQELGSSHNH